MNHHRVRKIHIPLSATFLLLALLIGVPFVQAWHRQSNPLRQAAVTLLERGSYHYDARVSTVQAPKPIAQNVGLESKHQQLALQGSVDVRQETMDLHIIGGDGGYASGTGVMDLRIADGVTRVSNGEGGWTETATPQIFAGDNDVLAYLWTATNISEGQREQRGGINLTRYTFDIDSQAFATMLTDRLENQLRHGGKLPAGMELSVISAYLEMTGSGEVWLDDAGLPLRQTINLSLPDDAHSQIITSQFTVNFSNIPPAPIGSQVVRWLGSLDGMDALAYMAVLGMMLALTLVLFRSRGSRRVYTLTVTATTIAMLAMPLIQADQSEAFAAELKQLSASDAANVAPPAAPLVRPDNAPPATSVAREIPTGGPNSDSDGLSDAQEAVVGTNSTNPDTDGDGLRDDTEVLELGTRPTNEDTDGDGLNDALEVKGFTGPDGRVWYLDPFNPDSNNDGQSDLVECVGDPACPDTDGDMLPDAFDPDNDNDGVSDRIDMAPTKSINGGMVNGKPQPLSNQSLRFDLRGYTPGKPLGVDLTLRPSNPDHLWYNGNVLDWPSDDRAGQIQRVKDTTLSDTGQGANGDMQLVPMLEIEIPFDSAALGGLPAKPGVTTMPALPEWTGDAKWDQQLQNAWFDSWLDRARLDAYQVSVRIKDDSRALIAYVPLDVVRDPVSGSPAAFSARMLYQPIAATFGPSHLMRLAWVIQVLKDTCSKPPASDSAQGENYNLAQWNALPASQRTGSYIAWKDKTATQQRDTWCANADNWQTSQAPVQTYYDDFYVTSLSITEDHGVDVTVALQKPGTAVGGFQQHLWNLARGIDRGLLGGRRDLTGQELVRRFDGSPAGVTPTERWGIPNGTLHLATYHFIDEGDQGRLFSGHVQNGITQTALLLNELNQTYVDGIGQTTTPTATVLLAREWKVRYASLDSGITVQSSSNGAAATLDITAATLTVQTGVKWQPFSYKGGRIWKEADQQTVLNQLGQSYQQLLRQHPDFAKASNEQMTGAIDVLKNYYMALVKGRARLVETDGSVNTNTTAPVNDAALMAPANAPQSLASTVQAVTDLVLNAQRHRMVNIDVNQSALLTAIGRQILYQDGGAALSLLDGLGDLARGNDAVRMLANTLMGVSSQMQRGEGDNTTTYDQVEKGIDVAGHTSDVIVFMVKDGKELMDAIKQTKELAKIGQLWTTSATKLQETFKAADSTFKKLGGWTTVVAIVVTVGIAIVKLVSLLNDGYNSVAFGKLMVETIASISYIMLMVAISSAVPIGTIIAVLAAVYDILVFAICNLTGLGDSTNQHAQNFCLGLAGGFAKLFSNAVQSWPGIVNFDETSRLDLSDWQVNTIPGPAGIPGYLEGNTLDLRVNVRTRLPLDPKMNIQSPTLWSSYTPADIDEYITDSTFAYEFTEEAEKGGQRIHVREGLDTGDMNYRWGKESDGVFSAIFPLNKVFTLDRSGINWHPKGLFLAEGYAISNWRCGDDLPGCRFGGGDNEDSNYLNLTDNVTFDVMPRNLDQFYQLTDRGGGNFALAWDSTFPVLADADGDTLRSPAAGGNDPADNDPDADNDGLSDAYEISHESLGLNPLKADTDGDGLTDYQEQALGTDPADGDIDNDGLTDGAELAGWEIVYGYDAQNQPLHFRTSSNPHDPDTDNDGVLDKQERTYGFNPRVFNDGEALAILSQIDEVDGHADGIVADASLIGYSATITNTLRDRYALGLFEVGLPTAASSASLAPRDYMLGPGEKTTLNGSIQLADLGVSQKTTLLNRAGAIIADLRSLSGGRSVWLHFDEPASSTSFRDSGVLKHDAVCATNVCPTSGENGLLGRSIKTPSGNSFMSGVRVPAAADLDTATWSVAIWVNPAATNEEFVARRQPQGGAVSYSVGSDENGKPRLHVQRADCSTNIFVTGSMPLPANSWSLLTATYDGTTLRLYVNGVQTASQAYNAGLCRGLTPITVGAAAADTRVDELSIYPFALTAAEVSTQFQLPVLQLNFDNTVANNAQFEQNVWVSGRQSIQFPNDRSGDRTAQFDKKRWLQVDGTNNGTLDLSTGNGTFTLASWVKPVPLYHDLDKWVGIMGNEQGFGRSASYPGLYAKFPKGMGNGVLKVAFGNGTIFCESAETGAWLTNNAWQHVAVTYTGDQFVFYLNGVEQQRLGVPSGCTNTRPAANRTLYVGRANPNAELKLLTLQLNGDEGDGATDAEYFAHWKEQRFWYTPENSVADNYTHTFADNEQPSMITNDGSQHFQLFEDDPSYDDLLIDDWIANTDITLGNRDATEIWSYSADGNGTLSYRVWNGFFNGGLDDVRVYRHAFTSQDARDLYAASVTGSYALNLRFEEPPTSRLFRDGSGNLQHALCAANCPISGLIGRDGQAARFDGTPVVVADAPALKQESGISLGAWLKLDSTNSTQVVASKINTNGGYELSVVNGTLTSAVRDSHGNLTTLAAGAVPAGVWVYVAMTANAGGQLVNYVNGTSVGSTAITQTDRASIAQARPVNGGSASLSFGANFSNEDKDTLNLTGSISDMPYYFQNELSSARVGTFCFRLYANNNYSGNNLMICDDTRSFRNLDNDTDSIWVYTTPPSISGGWLNLNPNEAQHVIVPNDKVNVGFSSLTAAAWINSNNAMGEPQAIIARGDGDPNKGFKFTLNSDRSLSLNAGNGTVTSDSWIVPNFGVAAHVAVTLGNGQAVFYVNGVERSRRNFGVVVNDIEEPVLIGRSYGCGNGDCQFFNGRMRDVALYARTLNNSEIASLAADQPQNVDSIARAFHLPFNQNISDTLVAAPLGVNDLPLTVGRGSDGTGALRGLIDELAIIETALPDSGIQTLYQQAPVLNMHFDEQSGATRFADWSPTFSGFCTGDCPQSGAHGRIRETPVFTNSRITVDDRTQLDPTQLSVELWVRPRAIKPQPQGLVDKTGLGTTQTGYGLSIPADSLKLRFASCANAVTSGGSLNLDQWNHVVATNDGTTLRIYINGVLDGSAAANVNCANNFPLYIGDLGYGRSFDGSLDELVIYNYALESSAVADHYAYQESWFDTVVRHDLTIDADAPTATVALPNNALIANATQVLALAASDPTSSVSKVEVNVGTGWQPATFDGENWFFSYTPTASNGQVTIQTRATDSVGHVSTPQTRTLVVDSIAPTLTLQPVLTAGVIRPPYNAATNRWELPISGTASDSNGAVRIAVTIRNIYGVVGAPLTLNGVTGAWNTTFAFPTAPNGRYALEVTATDALGNTSMLTNQIVVIDGTAPVSRIISRTRLGGPPQNGFLSSVSQALFNTSAADADHMLGGIVNDTPAPLRELNGLHFEALGEADSQCATGACPAIGAGAFGSAAMFDGQNDTQVAPVALPAGQNITLAVWVKPNGNGSQTILATSQGATNTLALKLDGVQLSAMLAQDGVLMPSGQANLTSGQWNLVTLSIGDGSAWLGVNGATVDRRTLANAWAGADQLWLGSDRGISGFFAGALDEVSFYGSALDEEAIRLLADPVSSNIAAVEARFVHFRDLASADGLPWQTAALGQSAAPFSTWSATPPAHAEGPYRVDLRTRDAMGNERIVNASWNGEIDTLAPRVSLLTLPMANGATRVICVANDYHLDLATVDCPLPQATWQPVYETASWYADHVGTNQHLIGIRAAGIITTSAPLNIRACDTFGYCSAAAGSPTATIDPGLSIILTPEGRRLVTNFDPIPIQGYAQATAGLSALKLTAGAQTIDNRSLIGSPKDLAWTTIFTPTVEGFYPIQAAAHATNSTIFTDTQSPLVIVDLAAPRLELNTRVITAAQLIAPSSADIAGSVTETHRLSYVQAQFASGTWITATTAPSGTNQPFTVRLNLGAAAESDSQPATVTLQAKDIAERTTTLTGSVLIDTMAPISDSLIIKPSTSAPLISGTARDGGGVATVAVGFQIQGSGDSIQWVEAPLAQPGATATSWHVAPPVGMERNISISLRLTDIHGNIRTLPAVWNGNLLTQAPQFTSNEPVSGEYGLPYVHTFVATGDPAFTFAVSGGTLPAGLTLNSTSGILSGTPLVAGTSVFTVTASNGWEPNATQRVTLTIAPATLKIAIQAQSREYGLANPPLTFAASGFRNGDNQAMIQGTLATTATITSSVGEYAITRGTLTAANYTLAVTPAVLTITPAPLNIIAAAQERNYGGANPSLTFAASGFRNGENQAVIQGGLATTAVITSTVGEYAITRGTLAAANYTLAVTPAVLTIKPAPLTITAKDVRMLVGDPLPTLSADYAGFVNGETPAVLLTQPQLVTSATDTSPIGTYPITVEGATAANYTITHRPGVLTIASALAPLIDSGDRTFDAYPLLFGSAQPYHTATISLTLAGETTPMAIYRIAVDQAGGWQLNTALDTPISGGLPTGGLRVGMKLQITVTTSGPSGALSGQISAPLAVWMRRYYPFIVN